MHKLNLLPKEILLSQSKKKSVLFYIFSVTVLLSLLILIIVSINNSIKFIENKIYVAQKDITEIKSRLNILVPQKLRDLEKRQNIYFALMNKNTNLSTTIDNIINLTPPQIKLTTISFNRADKIKINGYAQNLKYIAQFIEELNTEDNILKVSLGFIRLIDFKDEHVVKGQYNFEIVVILAEGRF